MVQNTQYGQGGCVHLGSGQGLQTASKSGKSEKNIQMWLGRKVGPTRPMTSGSQT